ncbi:MAG TPA: STAS domain-containing protein [Drouetiella sp.]
MSGENADSAVERRTETMPITGNLERAIDHIDRTLASGVDLVLDFSGCTFISVEGLEWLEELMLRSDSQGSKVEFRNLSPGVYKVFKVAHIDSLLRACGAPSRPSAANC